VNTDDLSALVQAVLVRYLEQNRLDPLAPHDAAALSSRLVSSALERGLPPPLPPGAAGTPGELPSAEVDPLVQRVLAGHLRAAELGTPVRQLLKACLQPEFRQCRRSYRAVTADGVCRRQQLERARQRVSGTHCVDCPYWTLLGAADHERFLATQWLGEVAEFTAHRTVFLPEDFRTLRVALCRAGAEDR
jgi:hypothetical protein